MAGRWMAAWALGVVGCCVAAAAAATAAEQPFAVWLEDVRKEAAGIGIGNRTLEAALTGIAPIDRVIELDRSQPEFTLSFKDYLARALKRVEKGREKMHQYRGLLDDVARKHGVQPRFIVALWGVETDFGRVTGGYPVVPALATLAYDGRRSAYFRKELMDALRILDQGHIGVGEMKGSWAGAMGQCQFMPSSFINFAIDHNGDGRKDIWGSEGDVLASAANYLAKSGWHADQTWGRAVHLPKGFDASLIALDKPKTLQEWRDLGVRKVDGGELPVRDLKAALVRPDAKGDDVFLVYENFRTILKWNRSNYFAAAVGILSDRLGERQTTAGGTQ